VTEAEWWTCADSRVLLEFIHERDEVSERKLRLFAVACCRRVWHTIGKHGRRAVEVAERYADGGAAVRELKDAHHVSRFRPYAGDAAAHVACASQQDESTGLVSLDASLALSPRTAQAVESVAQTGILRCLFGNPLRPLPAVDPAWLAWNGGAGAQLAESAYDDRRLPEGVLDPARLAVLADALEDAGCADAELLGHLRGPGPHVRGCWAVDLILAKR
jgi:hypothetical protein